jgi:hypothetical protein
MPVKSRSWRSATCPKHERRAGKQTFVVLLTFPRRCPADCWPPKAKAFVGTVTKVQVAAALASNQMGYVMKTLNCLAVAARAHSLAVCLPKPGRPSTTAGARHLLSLIGGPADRRGRPQGERRCRRSELTSATRDTKSSRNLYSTAHAGWSCGLIVRVKSIQVSP